MENPEKTEESKGLSIASMVLGIIAVVLFCIPYISIPCSILAIIFGIIGKNKGGKGMAIAGLVLVIVFIVLYFLLVVGAFSFFAAFNNTNLDLNILESNAILY